MLFPFPMVKSTPVRTLCGYPDFRIDQKMSGSFEGAKKCGVGELQKKKVEKTTSGDVSGHIGKR